MSGGSASGINAKYEIFMLFRMTVFDMGHHTVPSAGVYGLGAAAVERCILRES